MAPRTFTLLLLGWLGWLCCSSARAAAARLGVPRAVEARAPPRAQPAASTAPAPFAAGGGARSAPPERLRVAIVGDVHGQWDEGDASALRELRPPVDLCLFVGDFGDEDVVTVESCARSELPFPAASVFGNHDAWFSLDKRKRRPKKAARDYDGQTALDAQRRLFAPRNLEYERRELPELGLTVVGGRPYSIGGPIWPPFYVEQYGLASQIESADRIGRVATNAQARDLVFLAHNGPAGLGAARDDICGRDWPHRVGAHAGQSGGDWGDRDLADGIRMARKAGKRVPLVAFGHLHRRLIGGGLRQMVRVDDDAGTVFLNAAQVPRWRGPGVEPLGYDAAEAAAGLASAGDGADEHVDGAVGVREPAIERKQHWFAIVEMAAGNATPSGAGADGAAGAGGGDEGLHVERVDACWLESDGTIAAQELWYCRQAHAQKNARAATTQAHAAKQSADAAGARRARAAPRRSAARAAPAARGAPGAGAKQPKQLGALEPADTRAARAPPRARAQAPAPAAPAAAAASARSGGTSPAGADQPAD
ncbi:hypothetical protein KFE25_003138 [Diacronema lutheri]|uniref:Calcineurin-like phosphoesterase domain-containing protein n=1 Tax=Diacronema lutheri TaxID=2081491 RepID=A0A8J5X345_DIALT|nr:hypothetical protein KFE25_003138 [Diacronema lutheri]